MLSSKHRDPNVVELCARQFQKDAILYAGISTQANFAR